MINIIELNHDSVKNWVALAKQNQPCIFYLFHDSPFVWICDESKTNMDYIKQYNIDYLKLNGPGTTIVCSTGDYACTAVGSKDFCLKVLNKYIQFMAKKLDKHNISNNDFIYDGNKYGAYSLANLYDDVWFIGIHFSLNINRDLIQNICKKQIIKIPNKLPINITREELLQVIREVET